MQNATDNILLSIRKKKPENKIMLSMTEQRNGTYVFFDDIFESMLVEQRT